MTHIEELTAIAVRLGEIQADVWCSHYDAGDELVLAVKHTTLSVGYLSVRAAAKAKAEAAT